MSEKENTKQRIISLLSLDKRKIEAMDEDLLMNTIAEVDQVRTDAVRDGRFLGDLKRRRERKTKTETNAGRFKQTKKERC